MQVFWPMIIHFENGRLGNQLFQYCGLRSYCPGHRLIIVGCDGLRHYFDLNDACFIPKKAFKHKYLYKLFEILVFLLSTTRVFGRLSEEQDPYIFKAIVRKGLVSNVLVSRHVYFQHHCVITNIQTCPHVNPSLIHTALEWLRSKEVSQSASSLIFLHVRRGDYLNWPSKKYPAVLAPDWYQRSIKFMRNLHEKSQFILMGDDVSYIHDVFGESTDFLISENPPEVDMAIMSLCNSGILSASSFAWWGAFFAHANQDKDCVFLAPRYWAGHRSGNWHPEGFITDWITYLD